MPIHRLNHAVLYVRDMDTSVEFYESVLGFLPIHRYPNAAFMRAPGPPTTTISACSRSAPRLTTRPWSGVR